MEVNASSQKQIMPIAELKTIEVAQMQAKNAQVVKYVLVALVA